MTDLDTLIRITPEALQTIKQEAVKNGFELSKTLLRSKQATDHAELYRGGVTASDWAKWLDDEYSRIFGVK
jgi:hypothetical protein